MSEFARLQDQFQRGVMEGDDGIFTEILDSPKEQRDVLFGVYRNAYVLRLIEIVKSDHELTAAYLGDDMFDKMARAYIAARPSHHANARWFPQGLPAFLQEAEPYSNYPALGELAELEKALNDAFDAADAPILSLAALADIAPDAWTKISFVPHPSATRLNFQTNAAAIWSALKEDEEPPAAEVLDEPVRLIIWRHDVTPMWRELSTEEAMMWDEAANGIPFGVLCTMLATYDDPDGAAARAAGYLQGWISAELLSDVIRPD